MTSLRIKLAAAGAMLIDHVGAVLGANGANDMIITLMRSVGRVSFILFAFLVAEGCARTTNIKKYLYRLALFAAISEIPYNLFRCVVQNEPVSMFNILYQNVFFTWALSVAAVIVYKEALEPAAHRRKKTAAYHLRRFLLLFAILLLAFAADLIAADYGLYGVFLVLFLYINKDASKTAKATVIAIIALLLYGGSLYYAAGALAAIPIVLMYNGKAGFSDKRVKTAFYVFYPLHMLVLAGLSM